MRIALDGMGGDNAPAINVEGAVLAAREMDLELVLVGDEIAIRKELARHKIRGLKISLKGASQVVGMDEPPIFAMRRKKDSSIVRAVELLREGKVEALVSAGNTGATVAAAKIYLDTIPGVDRSAIATLMPTSDGSSVLLDAGANVDSRPRNLCQFAVMGSIYAECVLGKAHPRVGLLSIGHEESKGNELTKKAHCLLKNSSLNFVGNVEGRDVFNGRVKVVVCDGFIGNVVLKTCEGVAETLKSSLRQELKRSLKAKLGTFLNRKAYKNFQKQGDYTERGGAPLLGIEGVCVISHGGSSPKAIKNALKIAAEFVEYKVNERISKALTRENKCPDLPS